MKPIVDVTEGIGAQKWVTISAVRPILHKLLNVTLVEQDSDTSQQKAIKSAMRLNLQKADILAVLRCYCILNEEFALPV